MQWLTESASFHEAGNSRENERCTNVSGSTVVVFKQTGLQSGLTCSDWPNVPHFTRQGIPGKTSAVKNVLFLPCGMQRLLVSEEERALCWWRVHTKKTRQSFNAHSACGSAAGSGNKKTGTSPKPQQSVWRSMEGFSSVKDGIYTLGKAHIRSILFPT